jgi:hypothetical protein
MIRPSSTDLGFKARKARVIGTFQGNSYISPMCIAASNSSSSVIERGYSDIAILELDI